MEHSEGDFLPDIGC